ncbi:hypothetical protein RvY_01640 [Ramazzottius varieornatus]|uniref:Cullin family profile domain-containing protein n=1 Tax=Ramazzottius varieornatus TaxID=947166 RepID=A0A1D1UH37_RAMVA|nr:hypothetical protein RvY_01640 [Ramazzottius varieornatus]
MNGDSRNRAMQQHSMANRKITLEGMWSEVEPGLTSVFQMKQMSKGGYMHHYSTVYSYCTSMTHNGQEPPSAPSLQTKSKRRPTGRGEPSCSDAATPSTQAAWVGMELYKKLTDFISGHLVGVREKLKHHRGDELLVAYAKQWQDFRFSSKVAHGMCMYLNRHWVKRENDEGRHKEIYPVYGLCLVQWRENIFSGLETQLLRAIMDMITRDRNGELINSNLLRTTVDSIVELGVSADVDGDERNQASANRTVTDPSRDNKAVGLHVYKNSFESHFIDETIKFYTQESQSFLATNPVEIYIGKVVGRLAEEDVRCTKYLHESSGPLLKKTMEDVLIIKQMDILHAEFKKLLAEEKLEELASIYNLLSRVPNGVDSLYKLVETHIKEFGGATLANNAEQLMNDPRAFVLAILEVYDRSSKLIHGAFKGDHGFSTAMDKAFEHLVNNNAITVLAKNPAKVSELLARYCDGVLKKSTKNPDELELEESLTRLMVVFRYVVDKDVFQKFYSKLLSKRLVLQTSASDDAEASMISKLKALCGFEYTAKLQRMFQDIGLSRDLNDQLRAHLETGNRSFDCEFGIQVLSTGAWPLTERNTLIVPAELERPLIAFKDFYGAKYNGRKLTWQFNLSKTELSANCFSKKYIFQASSYQAAILLCFNSKTQYPVVELQQMVGTERPYFDQILVILLKQKVLLIREEAEEVDEKDLLVEGVSVKLNTAFKSKKLKINLNLPIRAEQKQEEDQTNKVIEEDRKLLIQATIVRIMKMRKQLRHQELMAETLQLLSNRFKPSVIIIKRCIEILIDKDFLKRDEEAKDQYTYVA